MSADTPTHTASSRRELLRAALAGAALASLGGAAFAAPPSTGSPPGFTEHKIDHQGHQIYARDYPGRGPAFVMLHGFPDNLHIYDQLIPFLLAAGRRVVVFDFLGFGQSDKPAPNDFHYGFEQQVGDLAAVVDGLKLEKFVLVGHDAGGPCAANYALDHPHRLAWLCLLNTYYADGPSLRFPELIQLFADPDLRALSLSIASTPAQMQWLLGFQQKGFMVKLSPEQKAGFTDILQPLINANFQGGAGPAFIQMTSHLRENVAYNTSRLADVGRFQPKTRLIWGVLDPYLTPNAAQSIASHYPRAAVYPVQGGHWLMIDAPEATAKLLLANA